MALTSIEKPSSTLTGIAKPNSGAPAGFDISVFDVAVFDEEGGGSEIFTPIPKPT